MGGSNCVSASLTLCTLERIADFLEVRQRGCCSKIYPLSRFGSGWIWARSAMSSETHTDSLCVALWLSRHDVITSVTFWRAAMR
jgi:hypothetical protein